MTAPIMTTLYIKNARLIDPASGLDRQGSLLAEDGVITALGEGSDIGTPPKSASRIDAKGAVLAPGLVDIRVQHKGIKALAKAAGAGGVTTLVCLPNMTPVLDDPNSLASLNTLPPPAPRIYGYGAATQGLEDEAMAELGLLAEAGAVGFTNGTVPIADSLMMRRVMAYAKMLGKPVIQHAEDPSLAHDGEMNEGAMATRLGLRGIPAEAEAVMIARDVALARLTGVHYHIAHLSTRKGVEAVRTAKAQGVTVSCDTAPPYFMLNDLAVLGYDTRFQLSPPLRSEDDRQAIVEGLVDGTIDCIASDHAPHGRDAKLLPFGVAARGGAGLETLLALVLGLALEGTLSLTHALGLITQKPAEILGLPAGRLEVGGAADLVLIDVNRAWQVKGSKFYAQSTATPFASTPFEKTPVQGVVLGAWAGGGQIHPAAEV